MLPRRLVIESLEPRRLLTGVTLITHGFGGSASDWVAAMGNAIAAQSALLASQPRYLMTVQDIGHDGGPLTVTAARLGPAYSNWASRDIVVLLDWSDVAGSLPFGGYSRSDIDVGAAVANQFLSPYSIPDLATPLAALPLHLIGHSRGAGVVAEMSRALGEHGVWVDQDTYLDPHPVDGVNGDYGFNFGDAPMRVYDNVQYADDFWHTSDSLFDFTGEAVNGAANLQLSSTILSNGGYSPDHSDLHLWYHGTIGPPYQDSDGGATIGTGWYTAPQGPRDQVGWRASRIGAGPRQSAGLKSAGAHRDAVTLSVSGANLWDNIQINGMQSDTTLTSGSALPLNITFEDKTAAQGGARDATVTYGLDRDDNPWNGVFSAISSSTTSLSDTFSTSLATSNISGGYRVYARISNGINARYYYATGRAIINAAGFTRTWIGSASGGAWSTSSNWSPAGAPLASDNVSIFASDVMLDPASTTKIAQLDLSGAGSLNLHNHNLVIDYAPTSPSPLADVRAGIIAGRAASPAGIYSDLANGSTGLQTLGYAEAADVLHLNASQTGSFASTTVDATAVLIRYTWAGDADLNGTVNGDDLFRIDAGYSVRAGGFSNGDFDYSAAINTDDYFLIDTSYSRQGQVLAPLSRAVSEQPLMPARHDELLRTSLAVLDL